MVDVALKKLPGGNKFLSRTEVSVLNYTARIPHGTTKEEVLHPEYWVNWVGKIKQDYIVTCLAEDGSFDMDLRAVAVGETYVRMRVIRDIPPGAEQIAAAPIGAGWHIKWRGPEMKWTIVTDEGKTVEQGIEGKQVAAARLNDLIEEMKAQKQAA